MLRAPSAVEQVGPYTVVIGDEHPFGDYSLVIRLLNTGDQMIVVSASASSSVTTYDDKEVNIEQIKDKIINDKNDWDHTVVGESSKEIEENIEQVLSNPDEVYEQEVTANGEAHIRRRYFKEMEIDGKEVIVHVLVDYNPDSEYIPEGSEVEREVITAFVPDKSNKPKEDFDYNREYNREEVVETIIEILGRDEWENVKENEDVIPKWEEGDSTN